MSASHVFQRSRNECQLLISTQQGPLLVGMQVPIPRGVKALQWLQGQKAAQAQQLLQPQVYFSPRQSSAPGTRGGAAAESASAGAGAVAGTHNIP